MTDDTPQTASPSYRLAALDKDFLLGDSMRGTRFLLEYAKADEQLRAWGVRSTIVVFGSARVREDGPGDAARWYAQARAFGRIASERGGALCQEDGVRDNVIATGGGPGIMEAANRGAFAGRSLSIGLNIQLPREQSSNEFQDISLSYRHFFARKVAFAKYATAFVAVPGGFGTLDELLEVLTLIQTRMGRRIPVLLVSSSEVYGKSTQVPFREDDDLVLGNTKIGRWSYACSKALDEFLALAYWREHGLPVIVVRLFNTAGSRQTGRYGMVLPTFVRQAQRAVQALFQIFRQHSRNSRRRSASTYSFSSVHCSGCWCLRARSMTWVTLVSATS